MRRVIFLQFAVFAAMALAACALLAPFGRDDEARGAAKVTLAAYETTQQAILIYGRLPTCGPLEPSRICKSKEAWAKIKTVEAAATRAIAEAAPVLNGSALDAGELVAALAAIENVTAALKDARTKLEGEAP